MSVSNPVRPARAKAVDARSTPIHIRVKKQQKELIDAAALLLGKNRSDFMLETACREAAAVILDQRVFHADSDQYRAFVALLDAPAENSAVMRAPGAIIRPAPTAYSAGKRSRRATASPCASSSTSRSSGAGCTAAAVFRTDARTVRNPAVTSSRAPSCTISKAPGSQSGSTGWPKES